MTETAIKFTNEEREWIQAYVNIMGGDFSEFVREAALEKVEDAADLQAYRDALEEDDGTISSMEEVVRDLATSLRCDEAEGAVADEMQRNGRARVESTRLEV